MFICFKEEKAITLSGQPLELVDRFSYLVSNISSTESNVSIRIERLWIIWKYNHFEGIKLDFFQPMSASNTIWMHQLNEMHGEKAKCSVLF